MFSEYSRKEWTKRIKSEVSLSCTLKIVCDDEESVMFAVTGNGMEETTFEAKFRYDELLN